MLEILRSMHLHRYCKYKVIDVCNYYSLDYKLELILLLKHVKHMIHVRERHFRNAETLGDGVM